MKKGFCTTLNDFQNQILVINQYIPIPQKKSILTQGFWHSHHSTSLSSSQN